MRCARARGSDGTVCQTLAGAPHAEFQALQGQRQLRTQAGPGCQRLPLRIRGISSSPDASGQQLSHGAKDPAEAAAQKS